jgi:hypothetical protein
LHGFDQLLRTSPALAVLGGIDHVQANVVFDYFGHEAVDAATRRDNQVQDGSATLFTRNGALERFDLAAHAPDAMEELGFFRDRM